jgi:hypothetical protein
VGLGSNEIGDSPLCRGVRGGAGDGSPAAGDGGEVRPSPRFDLSYYMGFKPEIKYKKFIKK